MCSERNLPALRASAPAARYHASANDLLASADVDVVDICLPTFLHVSHALEAMNTGRPVICEKPLALSVAEAKRVLELQRATGVPFFVAHVIRFWPQYRHLYDAVQNGTYGALRSASFGRLTAPPTWSHNGWMLDPNYSGGAIFDVHIHDIDFANHLLGRPSTLQSVYARERNYIASVLHYPDDLYVSVEGGTILPRDPNFLMRYSAVFDDAMLTFNTLTGDHVMVYHDGRRDVLPFAQPSYENKTEFFVSGGDGYFQQLRHFVECIRNNRSSPVVSLESVIETLEIIEWELRAGGRDARTRTLHDR